MECRSSEHRHVVKSSHSRRRLLKAELVVVISNKNEIIIDSNRALSSCCVRGFCIPYRTPSGMALRGGQRRRRRRWELVRRRGVVVAAATRGEVCANDNALREGILSLSVERSLMHFYDDVNDDDESIFGM